MVATVSNLVNLSLDPDGLLHEQGTRFSECWPYELCSVETVNLETFSAAGLRLMQRLDVSHHPRDALEFVRFVLAGKYTTEDPTDPFVQLRMDVRSQRNPFNPADIVMSYDIDSVIGIVHDLRMLPTATLSFYSTINFQETLTKTNHIRVEIPIGDNGETGMVFCHTVPNLCMAKFGLRGKVLACFPALSRTSLPTSSAIDADLLATWYNRIVRLAVLDIDPARGANIPVSYAAADPQHRTKSTGRLNFPTFDVSGDLIHQVCGHIRQRCEAFAAFRGVYFLVEIKGIKGATRTVVPADATEADIEFDRRMALAKAMEGLELEMLTEEGNEFYFDVAQEFTLRDHVLMLDRSQHPTLLQTVFPRISRTSAEKATKRRSYQHDTFAQTYQVAGARWEVNLQDPAYEDAAYYQAYFSVKTLTYSVGGDNVHSEVKATSTYPLNINHLCANVATRADAVREALVNDDSNLPLLDGAVRVEVRVPWHKVESVMTRRPTDDEMLAMFIHFQRAPLWTMVWIRLVAIATIFDALRQGSLRTRAESTAGALAAVAVSMLNSLFVRESDYSYDRVLREGVGRRVLADTDIRYLDANSPSNPVHRDHGMFFVSDVWMSGSGDARIFHLPLASTIEVTMAGWLKFYGVDNYAAYLEHFPGVGVLAPATQAADRVPNRRKRPTLDVDFTQQHLSRRLYGFAVTGVTLIPPQHRTGDQPGFLGGQEITLATEGVEHDEGLFNRDVNQFLEHLWAQFGSDIFACAPNQYRGGPSYLRTPVELRSSMTAEWMRSIDLRGVFKECRVRQVPNDQWGSTFDRYFPDKGYKMPNGVQNWKNLTYFRRWLIWSSQYLTSSHRKLVRDALREHFDDLAWVPMCDGERVWFTKRDAGSGAVTLPPTHTTPAVILILNPKKRIQLADIRLGDSHPDHPQMIVNIRRPTGRAPPADGGELSDTEIEGMEGMMDDYHDDDN